MTPKIIIIIVKIYRFIILGSTDVKEWNVASCYLRYGIRELNPALQGRDWMESTKLLQNAVSMIFTTHNSHFSFLISRRYLDYADFRRNAHDIGSWKRPKYFSIHLVHAQKLS